MRAILVLFFGFGWMGQVLAADAPLLSPTLYLYGVYGSSSADNPGDFAAGGHDPSRNEALVLQVAEPSISLRWGEYVKGFANGLAYTDENDDLEWEWEEYFLKLANLPGGFEVRGGGMLSRLGFQNPTHLHSWSTVDAPLMNSLFLGEDGLALEGADLSIYMDTDQMTVLTIGFGQRPSHSHGEEHEGYGAYEAYRVLEDVATIGFRRDHLFDDFRVLRMSAFGGMGDAEDGQTSWFAGAGFEAQWRENGLEQGGQALRWRTEAMRFLGDAAEEHDEDHDDDHEGEHDDEAEHQDYEEHGGALSSWGLTSELTYEVHPHAHPFLRLDYVSGSDSFDLPEWIRYTGGVTFPFTDAPHTFIRLQVNADERGDESEQAVWAQFGISLGSGEVR